MKLFINTTLVLFLFVVQLHAQESFDSNLNLASIHKEAVRIDSNPGFGNNGFKFETFATEINSKYSDYGVGFFRDKFISFSARKIGAMAKLDPNTKEPYTKLYCSDVTYEWDLRRPLLFSHILNKGDNLGTISFSKEGDRIYFSKSSKEDSKTFQLYTAISNPEAEGEWVNITPLPFNSTSYSIENPHLSKFDIFRSRNATVNYVATRNLGNTINSVKDEISYIPATKTIAYITSNREGGKGKYDIYKTHEHILDQNVSGVILDAETQISLADVTVVLLDANGEEVATVNSNQKGEYTFPVDSFLDYTILAYKNGFERNSTSFDTNTNLVATFKRNITLDVKPAEIVETKEKAFIKIDNILFDFNSDKIKNISTITLNTIVATLKQNPEIKVDIKAHTDIQGSNKYNLNLSDKRAASTMNYLLSKGISKDRLTSKGYGESQPLVDCKTCSDAQHEINRRVEFIIVRD